jgi:hypothetical protein
MAIGCNCPLWIVCSWSLNVYVATQTKKISHIINKLAIPQALKHASLSKNDISLFEINEAFLTTFVNPLILYFFISLLFPLHVKLVIVQFLMQMCVHIFRRWPSGGITSGGFANGQLFGLGQEQINIHGGVVSLGHPIGPLGIVFETQIIARFKHLHYWK